MPNATKPIATEIPPAPQIHKTGFKGLTANALKIFALVTMTVDHIGLQMFPNITLFRIIGRLSFPIFAYMIAEGCRYTKNKLRYFLQIFLLGIACQIVYFVAVKSLSQCVLITFSLSILCAYAVLWAKTHKNGWWLPILTILLMYGVTELLPQALPNTDFAVDYGFFGVILPVCATLSDDRRVKLLLTTVCLIALSLAYGSVQWWCLLTVPLLALYNGRRGKHKLKGLFYAYYPLHLAVIYLIALICKL